MNIINGLRNAPVLVEQRSIHLDDKLVSYTLKRSPRRRSIGLQINDHGLTVSMPLRASEKWLQTVLLEKAAWVVDKLENWQSRKSPIQVWRDGEAIQFRGETFTLRVVQTKLRLPPHLSASELTIHMADADNTGSIKKIVQQWYRREALRVFEECVAYFAPLMHVKPSEIKLTSARTQWGSCTASGVVRLNWQLVTMPLHLIDYVVVHELAHLLEMNHSSAFWKVVESVCPDYASVRSELRKWNPAADHNS